MDAHGWVIVSLNLRLYVVLIGAANRTDSFGAQLGSTGVGVERNSLMFPPKGDGAFAYSTTYTC